MFRQDAAGGADPFHLADGMRTETRGLAPRVGTCLGCGYWQGSTRLLEHFVLAAGELVATAAPGHQVGQAAAYANSEAACRARGCVFQ